MYCYCNVFIDMCADQDCLHWSISQSLFLKIDCYSRNKNWTLWPCTFIHCCKQNWILWSGVPSTNNWFVCYIQSLCKNPLVIIPNSAWVSAVMQVFLSWAFVCVEMTFCLPLPIPPAVWMDPNSLGIVERPCWSTTCSAQCGPTECTAVS